MHSVLRSTQTHVYQVLRETFLQVVQKGCLTVVGVQQNHVLDTDSVSGCQRSLQVQLTHLNFAFLQIRERTRLIHALDVISLDLDYFILIHSAAQVNVFPASRHTREANLKTLEPINYTTHMDCDWSSLD